MGGFKHARLTGGCLAALLLSATPGVPQAVSRGSDVAQPTLFVPGFVPKAPPTFGRDSIPSDAPDSAAEPSSAAATYSSGLEGDNYIVIELSNLPPDTEFFTIEGNTGNMVLTQQRKWSDVEAVGSVK